jgi:deoxyribodipyrimidine photo-lyase
MRTAIVWFRRDLRLADHPALNAALADAERVVPLYAHAPDEEAPWPPGHASRWWLHHSLAALDEALTARGARLVLRSGPSLSALLEVAAASGATRVYWNRAYEPAVIARDTQLQAALREHGLGADTLPGNLLLEPWAVQSGSGEPYRVFTPFWRACQPRLAGLAPPTPAPAAVPLAAGTPPSVPLAALGLLRRQRSVEGLAGRWLAMPSSATGRTSPAARDCRRTCTSARSRHGRSSRGSGSRARRGPGSRPAASRSSASSSGATSRTTCSTTFRTPRSSRSTRASQPLSGAMTRRRSARGSAAPPAFRWSTRACASCGKPVTCTIGYACSSPRC